MKRKTIIALLLVCLLCLALCACGSSEPKTTEAPATTEAPKPQTMSCGDWTVDVPVGYELKIGDFLNENDTRYFTVKKSSFSYFEFSADGEERIMNKYNYNKNTYTNEQKDVKGSFGGNEWVGFQYSDGYGGYGVEAYATIDGEMIRLASVGYAFDNEMLNTVLSSLKHTPSAEPATPETEAPETQAPETQAPETAAATESTEAATTEPAPVYVKTVELKDVTVGIPEGYTEVKDASPYQYVMVNDTTGGKVFILNQAGIAADQVKSIMSGLEYEPREEEINGMQWTIAASDSLWCFATTIGDDALSFTVDFNCTEEEMQSLILAVTAKTNE